jgi:replicative DNA helicase
VAVPALRVLLVDCENSDRQIRRKLRPLVATTEKIGTPIDRQRFFVLPRVNGLDLGRDEDRSWLIERVRAHKPDLVCIGPLYRLHNANLNDEVASRAISTALDAVRAEGDCALLIEAHSGHGQSDEERSVRPIGSSLWRRWPEFGYGLRSIKGVTHKGTPVHFQPWRGPRDERDWPTRLHHGSPWPWVGDWGKQDAAPKAVERYEEQEMAYDGDRDVIF